MIKNSEPEELRDRYYQVLCSLIRAGCNFTPDGNASPEDVIKHTCHVALFFANESEKTLKEAMYGKSNTGPDRSNWTEEDVEEEKLAHLP